MPRTISSSTATGVTLSNPSLDNPATILFGASVAPTVADALYGTNAYAWSISNLGTLRNTFATAPKNPGIASYSGIGLAAYGTIVNGNSNNGAALISAIRGTAIQIGGSGTVTNFASISGYNAGIAFGLGGTVVNASPAARIDGYFAGIVANGGTGQITNLGTITAGGKGSFGVELKAGGTVTNGTVGGNAFIYATGGVVGYAAPTTVTNLGTISAGPTGGVKLTGGGSVLNGASGATAALIVAVAGGTGVQLTGGTPAVNNFGTIKGTTGVLLGSAGTVTNQGTIAGGNTGYAVSLPVGGYLANAAAAQITSTGNAVVARSVLTLNNAGIINATSSTSDAAYLLGGTIINAGSGTISAATAVALGTLTATINNAGTITGAQIGITSAANASSADRIVNTGTITSTGTGTASFGVNLTNGGTVINGLGAPAARIGAGFDAVKIAGAPGLVANYGQIVGSASGAVGVYLGAGGTLVNGIKGSTLGTITGGSRTFGALITASNASIPVYVGNFGLISAAIGLGVINLVSTVTNGGTIAGNVSYGAAVEMNNGGLLTNLAGGQINGIGGGVRFFTAGTIVNAGTISGSSGGASYYGIMLQAGGIVSNGTQGGPGLISASVGITTVGAATVTNAATIIGTGGTAVAFSGSAAHRLVVLPGAVFGTGNAGATGRVTAPTSAANVIELAGTAGSMGTIANFASFFTGFQSVTIDPGASWAFTGADTVQNLTNAGSLTLSSVAAAAFGALTNNASVVIATPNVNVTAASLGGTGSLILAGGTLEVTGSDAAGIAFGPLGTPAGTLRLDIPTLNTGTVTGFAKGDLINFPLLAHATTDTATLLAGNTLHIATSNGGSFNLTLAPTDNFTGATFTLAADASGSDLTVACFAEGTRIETPDGPVAVEHLTIGTLVLTADGRHAPVAWLGHRRLDCRRHPRPHDVLPVRIRAGAFAPGLPVADLVLSPDHAVLLPEADVLTPVRYLMNGATILQQPADNITYWHVELAAHDIILAEGLACETYLDTGNRHAFVEGGAPLALHPDFARATWASQACRTLVLDGPIVAGARRRLLNRALAAGHARTDDPGLVVLADGRPLAATRAGDWLLFDLPPNTDALRLLSRHWTPADHRPQSPDQRRLGIAIRRIELDGQPQPAQTGPGWHGAEPDRQWTDGDAMLPIGGACQLAIELIRDGRFWREAA